MGEDDALGAARRVVLAVEDTADLGLRAKGLQRAVGHHQRLHAFRIARAGNRSGAVVPQPDLFERPVLVPVGHVERRPLVHQVRLHPRRLVPDADQPLGLVVRQRLQQDAVDDAEQGGVRADADAERQHRHGREQRRPEESPQRELERQHVFHVATCAESGLTMPVNR